MPTILVVDDSVSAIMVVEDILSSEGYTVMSCQNPGERLKGLLEESGSGIDLILMDVTMPGKSGDQWIRELKQNGCGSRMRMVLYSSMNQADLERLAASSGADGYIVKRDILTLINGVKKYLTNR